MDGATPPPTAPVPPPGAGEATRKRIRAVTGLAASADASHNKFLAERASDHRKPDGLFVATPAMGPGFVEDLHAFDAVREALEPIVDKVYRRGLFRHACPLGLAEHGKNRPCAVPRPFT